MQVETLWQQACEYLERVLSADVFSRWIAVLRPLQLNPEKTEFMFAVDNDFLQTWIEENYLSLIIDALQVAGCHPDIRVAFTVSPNAAEDAVAMPDASIPDAPLPSASKTPSSARPVRKPPPPPQLNTQFTFDNFVIGPSNSFAHAAATAVANTPAKAYNPLFIYGATALGKTHLMQAIGHYVFTRNARKRVCYMYSETLMNEYVNALQNKSVAAFRNKYRNTDVLLVDDIHFLAGKNALQEEFFHTFNALYDARKQIIMTSDRPASEISGLEHRLVSRFEWGLVTEIESPDLETRLAILRYKQQQSKCQLPDDILMFIAENIQSNVRRLEGALMRTLSYLSLTRQTPTVDALRHLLRDILEQESHEELKFDDIQRAVASHFDLRISDMSSKNRSRSIAIPRQMAMFLCRKMTRASLPEIANAFGKTHATVLHGCKAIQDRIDVESDIRDHVRQLSRKLGRDPQSIHESIV